MGRWSTMKRPKVLLHVDGLVHQVCFLDACFWRPECSMIPHRKPKGWTKQDDGQVVTCLVCLVGPPEKWFAT